MGQTQKSPRPKWRARCTDPAEKPFDGALYPGPATPVKRFFYRYMRHRSGLFNVGLACYIAVSRFCRQEFQLTEPKKKTTAPRKAEKSASALHQQAADGAPSALVDAKIKGLADWRGETLAHIRRLMHEAVPHVVEEVKWMGVPVWSHAGILCTGETYKQAVKMTFAKGASLPDPKGLFNSSLEGNTRRAIDVHEGDAINEAALKALFRAAADFNDLQAAQKKAKPKGPAAKKAPTAKKSG